MNHGLWTGSVFLVVCALICLVAGITCQMYQNYKEPLKGKTVAKVVELSLEEADSRKGNNTYKNCYYPIFEYYAGGKLYKVKYPHGSYPSRFHRNQELKLQYDLNDPTVYRIAQSSTLMIVSQALYVIGVIFLFTGCIIFLIFARRG